MSLLNNRFWVLRFRRGLAADLGNLQGMMFEGEPAYTTDTQQLYVGDASGNPHLLATLPAPPLHAVQFNNPLGTFAGSGDFTWITGIGLTIGGATETLGVVTPGVGEHVAIGNYGVINNPTFAPGDPINATLFPAPSSFIVNDYVAGNYNVLVPGGELATITVWPGFKLDAGSSVDYLLAMDLSSVINSDSMGNVPAAFDCLGASAYNYGSGTLATMNGIVSNAFHFGTGLVTELAGGRFGAFGDASGALTNAYGFVVSSFSDFGVAGAAVNYYGIFINDQSGGGSTTSYNILSAGTSFITPASKVGGNLFQGHVAVGNYADVGSAVFNPGDTIASTAATIAPLIVNQYATGNLVGAENDLLVLSGGLRHTEAGVAASAFGVNLNYAVNTNSTGNFGIVRGLSFNIGNFGSGNVAELTGISAFVDAEGSGTKTDVYGIYSLIDGIAGTLVNTYAGRFQVLSDGAAFTNVYGVFVDDHGGVGSSKSYNIFSKGTSFITPSSTTGGNLFQTHTAIGNYADVDVPYYAPGDPVNGGAFPAQTLLVLSDYVTGALTGYNETLAIWPGYKHTGAGSPVLQSLDVEPTINSDSTGNFSAYVGLNFYQENFGSGNISNMEGLRMFTLHDGAGTVANLYGIELILGATGTVTNSVALLIEDASGVGSASSYNILSAGAGGNLFQGNAGFGNTVSINAAGANQVTIYPGDVVNGFSTPGPFTVAINNFWSGDLSTAPWEISDLIVYSGYRHTGTNAAYIYTQDLAAGINPNSTGPIAQWFPLTFTAFNRGSGNVGDLIGVQGQVNHNGSGTVANLEGFRCLVFNNSGGLVTNARGLNAEVICSGTGTITNAYGAFAQVIPQSGTATNVYDFYAARTDVSGGSVINNYGLYVENQSGIGSSLSENIRSVGAASRNTFEGTINFGTATNTPQDGDFWFDGTNFKVRTGGTTKTVTAV